MKEAPSDGGPPPPLARIVSGGQTGVDRAALDVALGLGIDCGGWCPRGRRAEDGSIPGRYPLHESESPDYAARTRLNVRDSNATLVLTRDPPGGGTALTLDHAHDLARPTLCVDPTPPADANLATVRAWIAAHRVAVLNVAGPRESTDPGIGAAAAAFLEALLR